MRDLIDRFLYSDLKEDDILLLFDKIRIRTKKVIYKEYKDYEDIIGSNENCLYLYEICGGELPRDVFFKKGSDLYLKLNTINSIIHRKGYEFRANLDMSIVDVYYDDCLSIEEKTENIAKIVSNRPLFTNDLKDFEVIHFKGVNTLLSDCILLDNVLYIKIDALPTNNYTKNNDLPF